MKRWGNVKNALIGYPLGIRPVVALILAALMFVAWEQESVGFEGPPPNVKEEAIKLWKARCEKSGEFINEVVEEVDGILLINVRTRLNLGDQYALDDPYGSDLTNDGYLTSFLRGSYC